MYGWLILLATSTLLEMREDIIMAYAPDAPEPDAYDALCAIERVLAERES